MGTTPHERLLNIAEQLACASYMVAGSPDLVELRAAIAGVKSAAPVPASTGWEAIYQVQFVGEYASSVWHDATEDAYSTFMPERRRIVYTTPVAARELNVEAERREFSFGELLPCAAPKGPFADYSAEEVESFAKEYASACVSAKLGEVYSIAVQEKDKMERAARSAAQDTQAESAPVDARPMPEPSPLYFEALELVRDAERASVSMVQRRLRIGWDAARDLIELMLLRREIPEAWAPTYAGTVHAAPSPNSPVGGKD